MYTQQVQYLSRRLVLFLVLMLSACTTTLSIEPNAQINSRPDITKKLRHSEKIIVLPPQIDYQLHSFADDPVDLPVAKEQIKKTILVALSNALASKHYSSEIAFEYAPLQRLPAYQLQERYQLKMDSRDLTKQALPALGPGVNRISAAWRADILVLSRFSGSQKSVSQHSKDSLVAWLRGLLSFGTRKMRVSPSDTGEFEVALIDGVTGQVYWTATALVQPQNLRHRINQLFENLPLGQNLASASNG